MNRIVTICVIMIFICLMISGPLRAESLWDPSSKDSLFFDPSAKQINDILTVLVVESTSATRSAKTTTKKDSGIKGGVSSLFGIENSNKGGLTWDVGTKNDYEGSGTTTGSGSFSAKIAVMIVETTPNGYYLIEGKRNIMINKEEQIMTLTGIVRPEDIRWDNTVYSSQIADFDLQYIGKGPINEKQRPGFLTRFFDWIWIF
jgi:flagellar L-ring protein FlgH